MDLVNHQVVHQIQAILPTLLRKVILCGQLLRGILEAVQSIKKSSL